MHGSKNHQEIPYKFELFKISMLHHTKYNDILIKNGNVLTVDNNNRIIRNGAIYVKGNRILDVGNTDDLSSKYSNSEKVIDAKQNLVMPGLINAHTHMSWYLTRGLGMDKHTRDWLRSCIFPFLSNVSSEEMYVGAFLGCVENLRSGTTFTIDNNFLPKNRKESIDNVAKAVVDSGIRSIVLRGYHDVNFMIPEIFVETFDDVRRDYVRIIEKWHNKYDGRIKTWIHPVNLLYCSTESLAKLSELAHKYDIGIHTHVAEDQEGMKYIRERFNGKGYVDVFYDLGILGPKFQMAHTIFVSEQEIQYIAKTQARVIYTPTADMLLAAGVPPIHKMKEAGITVALGSDSPNNSQDMIQCMKFGALLQKAFTENSTIMPASEVLRLATIEGAKAIGVENELGSLEVGKKADIVIVDINKPHTVPMYDPVSTLVYSSNGNDVDTVIINGEVIIEKSKFTSIDEEDVLRRAREASENIIERIDSKTSKTRSPQMGAAQ
ncbi:MAG: amidohydrolase family protein, partial [Nitrososphaeraceae archaeon]